MSAPIEDDEIDLRPYLRALFIHWRWLILCGVVLATIAAVISLLTPKTYEATATFLLTRKRSTLSLSAEFPTTTESTDVKTRADTLLTIAQSDAVAQAVAGKLASKYSSGKFTMEGLQAVVKVMVKGEAFIVTAKSRTPELAAEIANAWADEVIQTANEVYRGEQSLEAIRSQKEAARQQYDDAQAALQDFLQTNQINVLTQQIAEAQIILNDLGDDRVWLINYYTIRQRNMTDLIARAEALKALLEKGTASNSGQVSDALALLITRMNAFGLLVYNNDDYKNTNQATYYTPGTSLNILNSGDLLPVTVQLSDLTSLQELDGNALRDLETVIQIAKSEQSVAVERVAALTEQVMSAEDQRLQEVGQAVNQLQAQLEIENARKRELTNSRDLAWSAYQALLSKETEIENIPDVSNEVVLAGAAVVPTQAVERGVMTNAIMGGVVGIVLAFFVIIGRQWWQEAGMSLSKAGG